MNESTRLSDLIGIHRKQTDAMAWPINLLMVALGAVILAIAFANLNADEPRPLYNPWTYAVLTPVALGLISLLGAMFSRVIERTMQIAFLLSVLIHLLLMVYATQIVILSKMWPDVFEALAKQRQVLQKFEKQVARYHTLNTNPTGRRPDYLRFVPTTHQPSESPESVEAALQVVASQKTDIATPKPELERRSQPHLVPREKAQLAPARSSDVAARLSRSDLAMPKPEASLADVSELAWNSPTPKPLQAEEAAIERQSSASIPLANEFKSQDSKTASAAMLDRARNDLSVDLPSPTRAMERGLSSLPPKQGAIPVPKAELSESTATELATAPSTAPARNRSESLRLAGPTTQPELPSNTPSLKGLKRAAANTELRLPVPNAGDRPNAIARESAGGRVAAGAPIAMPLSGALELATPEPGPAELTDSLSQLTDRGARPQRSTSHLPDLGLSQTPIAKPESAFSHGTDGNRSGASIQRAVQGQASSESVADLAGAGRTMQRSTVGIASQSGSISVPDGAIDGSVDGQPLPSSVAESGATRSRSDSATLATPSTATSDFRQINPGVANGVARNTGDGAVQGSAAPSNSSAAIPKRSGSDVARQSAGAIEIPADANSDLNEPASPGDRVAADTLASVSRSSTDAGTRRGRLELPLDAPIDLGGLADFSKSDGTLLQRPTRTPEIALSEIETQRFAKKDVGGPLAAGNSIPLPKPAFRQRLDRLKDRTGIEDIYMGPQTELAIETGLEFLAKRQSESGAWRLQDFDTKVLIRSDTAATGLALLAFQGAGYTHQQYQYAENVQKGLQFLLKNQRPDGDLYKPEDPASDQNGWLYSHAIAALALSEAYGMTQDPALRLPAQKAIDFMVKSQDPNRGGWRYRPGNGTDTSVSGWFMMAFKSGQLAGLNVPSITFSRIEKYLDQSQVSPLKPHLYRYNPYAADTPEQRHGREPTPVMTSAGLLMRLYFGWRRDQIEMMNGADYLLQNPPSPGTPDATLRDTYYWYYSTQVLFHMGGERWKQWHAKLYPMLIETQVTEGPMAGSWDPYLPTADLWARYGGRLYVTTMNLLSLEVNYRHLPLYDSTAK